MMMYLILGAVAVALLAGLPFMLADLRIEKLKKSLPEGTHLIGMDGYVGVSVVEPAQLIVVKRHNDPSAYSIPWSDFVDYELVEEAGGVVHKATSDTKRAHVLGGAIDGAIFGGRRGALIGSLTGGKKTSRESSVEEHVSRIVLTLSFRHLQCPEVSLKLLSDYSGRSTKVSKGDARYGTAMDKARNWTALLNVISEKASRLDAVKPARVPEALPPSAAVSDASSPERSLPTEIRKLAELRESGVLTQQEFEQAKARLLRDAN
jgi:hypothetical protein